MDATPFVVAELYAVVHAQGRAQCLHVVCMLYQASPLAQFYLQCRPLLLPGRLPYVSLRQGACIVLHRGTSPLIYGNVIPKSSMRILGHPCLPIIKPLSTELDLTSSTPWNVVGQPSWTTIRKDKC